MRYRFGGGIADWTFRAATAGGVDGLAQLVGGQQVTFWTDREGGSQHTNLLDSDSNPATSVTSLDGGGVAGQIPLLWGPDGVQAMWAQAGTGPRALMVTWDAREHTHDASAITSGPLDPARLPEGYGGGGGAALGEVWVAASDAPDEYTGAEYTCDGTADDVQIQAALDNAAGRAVRLTPGRYTISSPILINIDRNLECQALIGSGMAETVLDATEATIPSVIVVSSNAAPLVQDMTIQVGSATSGVTGSTAESSTSMDGGVFRRLRVLGEWDAAATNWGIDFDSAILTCVENVEIDNMGNGVRFRTTASGWSSFQLVVRGVFAWTAATGGRVLSFETAAGKAIHTVDVSDCYLGGVDPAAAIYMGGAAPVQGVTVRSSDATARTGVHINNGVGNRVQLSRLETDSVAGRTAAVFDAGAFGNEVSIAHWQPPSSAVLVSDANTVFPYQPNIVGPVRVVAESAATVTLSRNPLGTTVVRGIAAGGSGTTTAVQRSETVDAPHHVISLASATTHTIDCRRGSHFRFTATGNFTLANPVNAVDGQRLVLDIKQDGTGSRVMTLGSAFRFSTTYANATLTTAANKTDKLIFQYDGPNNKWDLISFVKGI